MLSEGELFLSMYAYNSLFMDIVRKTSTQAKQQQQMVVFVLELKVKFEHITTRQNYSIHTVIDNHTLIREQVDISRCQ